MSVLNDVSYVAMCGKKPIVCVLQQTKWWMYIEIATSTTEKWLDALSNVFFGPHLTIYCLVHQYNQIATVYLCHKYYKQLSYVFQLNFIFILYPHLVKIFLRKPMPPCITPQLHGEFYAWCTPHTCGSIYFTFHSNLPYKPSLLTALFEP